MSTHADLTARAAALVEEMTLEEKASLTSGHDFWHTKGVERLGLVPLMLTDGPHGLRKQAGASDHLGLNSSVPATCFPPAANLGSTWDPELVREIGVALGEETSANGVAVLLGPGTNIKRSPLCGRNFEYFSEDPLLSGELAAALVDGVQSQGVGTSLKHFAANNQETDRMRVDARIDERTLREIYLPAFETTVRKAQPWTVMCSYNKVNGTYASQNRELLTRILREEWGFEGLVVSDWGAVDQRVPALEAGLDLEMPASGGRTDAQIVRAVRDGELDESVLDAAATRIVTMILRATGTPAREGFDANAHHELARRAAAAGSVLLRNEDVEGRAALPLRPSAFTEDNPLVLIGEFARTPRYQGAGSSQVNPIRLDTVLDSLRARLGEEAVAFAPGFHLAEAAGAQDQDGTAGLDPRALRENAVALAEGRTAVLFLGLPAKKEAEGYDRTDISLPAEQIELLRAVSEAASLSIVVLSNGSAVEVESWESLADALLEACLGGQGAGSAIADMLLGDLAPEGRLAESLPAELAQVPAQLNFPGEAGVVEYGERIFVGYRGLDAMNAPVAHPFGSGLAYTRFEFELLRAPDLIDARGSEDGDVLSTIRVRVTNVGDRAGAEIVQLYAGRESPSRVARAPRALAGFAKLRLEAGQSREIDLPVTRRALSHWDAAAHRWAVEEGRWILAVGEHSRDSRHEAAVEVLADAAHPELVDHSTLAEWTRHPLGRPLLEAHAPGLIALAEDPEIGEMMGAMPLVRLSRFPGMPITEAQYEAMLAELPARGA